MKLNEKQIAKEIDALAKIKVKQAKLAVDAERHALVIKKAGGGESAKWIAKLVKMPRKVVIVKAHKRLNLVAK